MIQATLLEIAHVLVKDIHLGIYTVVSNDIWVQFEALTTSCIVLSVCAITRTGVASHIVHVNILMHHSVGPVRGVHHITW